jgi:hypothetical protein
MATQTTHYDMTKQQSPERVSVGLLNDNFDIIDGVMFANQEKADQMADDYNASETYNTGDYVRRENYIYKCNTDNTTGTWDDTKWDRVKVMDEISQGGGGGGSSTLAGLNDVNISSPTDGQALVFDNATQKWVNRAGGGGSSTFAGLNDVNVQGVSNGDIARYNSTTQKWTDSSDLTDLELTVSQLQASVLAITDGHTILAPNGTAMTQEDGLQFASGCVEDDPVNGKTIYIEMIRISQANYDTLKANGQLKPGAKYFIYDAQPVAVNASNLPYSSTQSTKQKIDSDQYSVGDSVTGILQGAGFIDSTYPTAYGLIELDKPLSSDISNVGVSVTDNKIYCYTATGYAEVTATSITVQKVLSGYRLYMTFAGGTFNSSQLGRPMYFALNGTVTFA